MWYSRLTLDCALLYLLHLQQSLASETARAAAAEARAGSLEQDLYAAKAANAEAQGLLTKVVGWQGGQGVCCSQVKQLSAPDLH
jgi:hypothetical protein